MKRLLALLTLSLCSCATQQADYLIQNGCVITAVNKQAQLKARNAVDQSLWSEILVVRYIESNAVVNHAFCLFNDANGNMYAYDFRGTRKLATQQYAPMEIARQLVRFPVDARWE